MSRAAVNANAPLIPANSHHEWNRQRTCGKGASALYLARVLRCLRAEFLESSLQLISGGGAAIDQKPIVKLLRCSSGNLPIGESRDVWIDQSLLVGAPA